MIHIKINDISYNIKESQLEKLFYSLSDSHAKIVKGLEDLSDALAALDNIKFMLKRREIALKLFYQKINYKTLFDVVYDLIIVSDELKKLDVSTHEHIEYNIDLMDIFAKTREHKEYKKFLNYIIKTKATYKDDAEFILFLYYWKDDLKDNFFSKEQSNDEVFLRILKKFGFHIDDVAEIIVKQSGEIFLKILHMLITWGAKTDLLLEHAILRSDIEFVEEILSSKANPNVKDHTGETMLGLAVERGDIIIVETLLQHNTDINIQNINGETALLKACKKLDLTLIEILLNKGADPNIADKLGNTPILAALYGNNLQLISFLLLHKAEYQTIKFLLDPVHTELRKKYLEVFIKLINLSQKQYQDILEKNIADLVQISKYIVEYDYIKANINSSSSYSAHIVTPANQNKLALEQKQHDYQEKMELDLINAVVKQNDAEVLSLLKKGVSPNINNKFKLNHSHLIHYTIWQNDYNITKYLLEYQTNVNTQDVNGDTPIFFATFKKNLNMVKLLLAFKADPYLTNFSGVSAYDLARSKKLLEFINLMKKTA